MSAHRRRAVVSIWVAALVALAAASCSEGGSAVRTVDVEYLQGRWLTIHAPDGAQQAVIVVVVHGAGLDRHDYRDLAHRLAEEGAVVFNADWSVVAPAKEIALAEIACATRYARFHGPDHGGDPARVVLVGHSTGAIHAGGVATGADERDPACPIEASSLPDGLVLVSAAQVPGGAPWPYSSLDADQRLRIVVLHGRDDTVVSPRLSQRTFEVLHQAGYEVSLELLPGGHRDLVLVDRVEGVAPGADARTDGAAARVIDAIIDLVPPGGDT